jgi:hypothetical protein
MTPRYVGRSGGIKNKGEQIKHKGTQIEYKGTPIKYYTDYQFNTREY